VSNYAGEISGAFQVLNKQEGTLTTKAEAILKAVAAQAAIATAHTAYGAISW
jgi:hypothetical protein